MIVDVTPGSVDPQNETQMWLWSNTQLPQGTGVRQCYAKRKPYTAEAH